MTERLYYLEPDLREFTARVVRKTDKGVVLDRTAFFPTGGGQPCDLGTLGGAEVTDVIEEGDEIVHVLSRPIADEVTGIVDDDRRRDHMQQHHGQHLLSEAFVRVAAAQTSSFHLGRAGCTIDLDKVLTAADIERAETLANRTVCENRPVSIGTYAPAEAAKLPLRKPPPETPRIRVVTVHDFDCQPCCGTHPRATGEVGAIRVTGWDKARIHFVCGLRAMAHAREEGRVLRSLTAKLSAGREELEKTVDRVREEFAAARRQLAAAEKKLAEQLGRELAARGRVVVEVFEGKGIEYLRSVATQIVALPGKVAILGGTGETSSLVLARSRDVAVDLRPIFKEAIEAIQGKGGGQAHFVQGGGAGKDVRVAIKLAEEKIVANLGS